jgi:chorismate-pyruvate lyase
VSRVRTAVVLVALLSRAAIAARGQPADAAAMVRTLNAELLASRSATQVLSAWCGDHHLAADPTILARRDRAIDKRPSAEQREHLRVSADEPVAYRHVRLHCGARILSEADNWYVPARLTAEMNHALETTDTSFGTVVRPLEPTRETLSVTMFWPAPAGEPAAIPDALFAHRAVLFTRDHVPFSEVYAVYRRQVLP